MGYHRINEPTKIPLVVEIQDIFAGAYHSACVDKNGELWTFGGGICGQLGRTTNSSPNKVSGLRAIERYYQGPMHCVLKNDDGVFVFGQNDSCQLGIGVGKHKNTPHLMKGYGHIICGAFVHRAKSARK